MKTRFGLKKLCFLRWAGVYTAGLQSYAMGLPPAHLLAFKPRATWWCRGLQRHRRLPVGQHQGLRLPPPGLLTPHPRLPRLTTSCPGCAPQFQGCTSEHCTHMKPLCYRCVNGWTHQQAKHQLRQASLSEHKSMCLSLHTCAYMYFFHRRIFIRNAPNYQIITSSCIKVMR